MRASPWVTEIRWFFEGKEVHTNTSAGVIVSNQSLVLQRVTRHHRGRYTCSASNSEGEGESNSVHLRVQFAPVCKTSQKILYGAARQESVKIHCTVDADPPEVTFRWAFNSSSEHLELVNHASEGGTSSVATYVPRSEIDYGTLFCWGRNAVGSQAEPCVFSVIPAGPPDSVSNCSVTNVTEDSLKVDCGEGYDGGLSQHFVMEVRDSLVQRLRANVTSGRASFTARSLSPGTAFLLVIYSSNAKGRSKAIVLTASTLALPESMNRMAKGQLTLPSIFNLPYCCLPSPPPLTQPGSRVHDAQSTCTRFTVRTALYMAHRTLHQSTCSHWAVRAPPRTIYSPLLPSYHFLAHLMLCSQSCIKRCTMRDAFKDAL